MRSESFSQKMHFADKCYLALSTLLSTLFGLVLPFSILIIFDRVLPNQATNTLYLLFLIILVAVFFDLKLKKQEDRLTSFVMKRFETNISNRLFNAICTAELSKFKRLELGEYLERISSVGEIKAFFGGETIRAMINLAVSLLTILIVALINKFAGLTLLIASLILVIFAIKSSKEKIKNLSAKSDIEGLATSKIIEIISNPLDIKARNMEFRLESLMGQVIDEREIESVNYEKIESDFDLILSLIQQLSVTCVVVVLACAVIQLESSQGVMAAIIMLTNRYFGPYQQVMRTLSRWQLNKLHIERLAQLLELSAAHQQNKASGAPDAELESGLIKTPEKTTGTNLRPIEKITVHLSKQTRIEFTLGHCHLFRGKSGSGKTQLLSSIAYQLPSPWLASGQGIFINERQLSSFSYLEWRNQVLMLNKDSQFLEGSIIDNLTCFRPYLNDAAFSLCETLQIKDKVNSLAAGFYTELKGHLRHPFSRQISYALFIVRALLADVPILIFDDFDTVYDKEFARLVLSSTAYYSDNKILVIVSNQIDASLSSLKEIKLGGRDEDFS